jgi:hypothetical protein
MPLAWLKAAEAPKALRACHRCTHGTDAGIERICTHPALADWAGAPQPVAVTRAWGGGCGPDARHLSDAALQE